jgi:hypothetical protein
MGLKAAQSRSMQPMEVVVRCREGVGGIAKAPREIVVPILALRARVELIMVVGILDVELCRCDTYDWS